MSDFDTPQIEMPKYKSHKIVHALKLASVSRPDHDGHCIITPADGRYAKFNPKSDWSQRFKGGTEDPGYYVVYEDGYASWSPTKAFEDGYTPV